MKFLCLACPHGNVKFLKTPLQDIDAVLIAGDLGKADKARALRMKYPDAASLSEKVSKQELEEMTEENISSSYKILKYFSKKPTYFVFGNADNPKATIERRNKKYGMKIKPLEDRIRRKAENINGKVIKIGNIKVAGLEYFCELEWVKTFVGKDAHRTYLEKFEEKQAKTFLSKLEKVDILLTHNPPYGYLDLVDNPIVPKSWNGKHAGSHSVLEYIKRKQPKYVICGHIHEARRRVKIGKTTVINTSNSFKVLSL